MALYQQKTAVDSDRLIGNNWIFFKLHGAI
jgi:hypothetical protein